MCGRFVQSFGLAQVLSDFDLEALAGFLPPGGAAQHSWNIGPMASATIVRSEAGTRSLTRARWGLVPGWARDEASGVRMFNARAETVQEKPAYRGAFRHRRCVVPMSGFYEWKQTSGGKQPWYVTRADGKPMACAGLWEYWEGAGDHALETFTVITTAPNAFMQTLHDRMPVVLEPADIGAWLDGSDAASSARLLAPAAEGVLRGHAVSKRVGNVRINDASLVDPIETQGEMF